MRERRWHKTPKDTDKELITSVVDLLRSGMFRDVIWVQTTIFSTPGLITVEGCAGLLTSPNGWLSLLYLRLLFRCFPSARPFIRCWDTALKFGRITYIDVFFYMTGFLCLDSEISFIRYKILQPLSCTRSHQAHVTHLHIVPCSQRMKIAKNKAYRIRKAWVSFVL